MSDTTQPREQAGIDLDKLREAFDAEGPNYRITVDRFKHRPDTYKFEQASQLWEFVQAIAARGGFATQQAAPEAPTSEQEKFCDSHCVWSDHHPDCTLLQDAAATASGDPKP